MYIVIFIFGYFLLVWFILFNETYECKAAELQEIETKKVLEMLNKFKGE